MPNEKNFSPKIFVFNSEIRLREQHLQDNKLRLVTSAKALINLEQLNGFIYNSETGWVPTFDAYMNPATKTKLITDRLSDLRVSIEKKFQLIYIDIPHTELTDNDRLILNIPRRDNDPTHVELFKFPPTLTLESSNQLFNTIRISNPETPDTAAMPHRHHCHLNVGFKTTATGPIIWDADRFYEPHTSLFDVHYILADRGKEAFVRARYVSPTGELGEYCPAFSNIVV